MTRDIDKEKKDQRIAEVATIKEVRKQQTLQTVLRSGSLRLAAKTLATTQDELRITLLNYGVKHEPFQTWHNAVKEYLDAGQPYQYEMNLLWEGDWLAIDIMFEEGLEAEINKREWNMQAAAQFVEEDATQFVDRFLGEEAVYMGVHWKSGVVKPVWNPAAKFVDLASTNRSIQNYSIELEQQIKSKYEPLKYDPLP